MRIRGQLATCAACAVLLLLGVPSGAQASIGGGALFKYPTGGRLFVPLHPAEDTLAAGGSAVFPTSPAYLVLRYARLLGTHEVPLKNTVLVERYSESHNFAWVAVVDTTPGHTGTECMFDAHLLVLPFFVSDLFEDRLHYHGLFLVWKSHQFRAGDLNANNCGLVRGSGPVIPSLDFTSAGARLHLDCVANRCRGRLFAFGPASGCRHPTTIFGRTLGCPPIRSRTFSIAPGKSVLVGLRVPRRTASRLLLAILPRHHRPSVQRLGRVGRPPPRPRRPARTSITEHCPGGGTAGATATVSGRLTPGSPPASVIVSYSGPGSAGTALAVTNATGSYAARFTPSQPGTWTARAEFLGDRSRKAAASATCSFQVAKQPVTMALQCPAHVSPGSAASISGSLTPAIGNASVTLHYQPPSGSPIDRTVTTDANGSFSDSGVAPTVNQSGHWSVSAAWSGDATHQGTSNMCGFDVS